MNKGFKTSRQRTAAEQLFDLSNDSQDTRLHPRPHLARKSPNKTAFNVFQTSLASDSDDRLGQIEREVDQTEEVDNPRMGALKFLSSLQKKWNTPVERGLMYVDTWINQKPTKSTMVDSSATYNFITEAEAKRLNLRWEKDAGRMKVVNLLSCLSSG
ncbi:Importin subunit alpha-2 [Cucumis melo var. makuwa]|uniref:Importin subunit alpha-2 n=1 Tax=Cucumis melo var. makuwa TaxID=1194695 RepID=A0A5D3D5C5_CUCMM|nr:Importin subunit alpha-2 [Cucumis melo var. makuwa]